uniref:TetR_C_8 domain-containing protein n=1 Tax=Meloidogyne hapla TaxID=6305 RepID=A0A1I8BK37_MELHA
MDFSNRETFFKFLAHCDKAMANQIGNLINKIIKSDLLEEGDSQLISRLCCWTLTTFVINAIFLLDGENIVKISYGINIIDTYEFLKKLIEE